MKMKQSTVFVLAITTVVCVYPELLFASDFVHTAATLSEARDSLVATTVGDQALFAGGYDGISRLDVVDIYTIPEPAMLLLLGFVEKTQVVNTIQS